MYAEWKADENNNGEPDENETKYKVEFSAGEHGKITEGETTIFEVLS